MSVNAAVTAPPGQVDVRATRFVATVTATVLAVVLILASFSVRVAAVLLGGMKGGFGPGQSEDQPAVAGIDMSKAQHIPEERPVGRGVVVGEHPKVDAGGHHAVLNVVHRVGDVVGPVHDLGLQAQPLGRRAVSHPGRGGPRLIAVRREQAEGRHGP